MVLCGTKDSSSMALLEARLFLRVYCVNHLTQPVQSYIFSLEHRFYQLAVFTTHLRVPVFKFPRLTFSPQGWPRVLISLIIWNKEIFSLTALHRHTHICVISPLLLHSLICTLMLIKSLASNVGLRKSTYRWLCERRLGLDWSVIAPPAVAGAGFTCEPCF